jgi:hypothetical protein
VNGRSAIADRRSGAEQLLEFIRVRCPRHRFRLFDEAGLHELRE